MALEKMKSGLKRPVEGPDLGGTRVMENTSRHLKGTGKAIL